MQDAMKDCSPLGRADFESDREYRLWAITMVSLAHDIAESHYKQAENLAAEALSYREAGNFSLSRAKYIANELARFLDGKK